MSFALDNYSTPLQPSYSGIAIPDIIVIIRMLSSGIDSPLVFMTVFLSFFCLVPAALPLQV